MTDNWISKKQITPEERLIVALDVPGIDPAKQLVETLGDSVHFYKCGMELFMCDHYFEMVDWLKKKDKKVFVDLKFFDVPATVSAAVARLSKRGVDFATVHGNDAMLKAASETKGDLKILGVTVLTSLDRGDLDDLGFDCDVENLVVSRARRALENGCDGVISSGLEAPRLRQEIDQKLMVVCPGIRPVENKPADDQKRTVDVEKAFRNGADYIVMGRPIRNADDPRAKAMDVQSSIGSLFK